MPIPQRAVFESGYETTKDRMAEGQPQVVFYDLSQQQIELLYSEENIESIKVTETENGYDASITIVDATKMTQYGFSSRSIIYLQNMTFIM